MKKKKAKTSKKTARPKGSADPEAKRAPEVRRILNTEEDGMILENVFEREPEKD